MSLNPTVDVSLLSLILEQAVLYTSCGGRNYPPTLYTASCLLQSVYDFTCFSNQAYLSFQQSKIELSSSLSQPASNSIA